MWKSFNQFQQFQWIPVTDVTRIFEIFQFKFTIFICDINLDLTGNRIQHFWLQIVFIVLDCHWSPFRISSKKESFTDRPLGNVEERFIDCIQCFIHHFYQFFDFFVIWVICKCEWLLISNEYLLYGRGLKKSILKAFSIQHVAFCNIFSHCEIFFCDCNFFFATAKFFLMPNINENLLR